MHAAAAPAAMTIRTTRPTPAFTHFFARELAVTVRVHLRKMRFTARIELSARQHIVVVGVSLKQKASRPTRRRAIGPTLRHGQTSCTGDRRKPDRGQQNLTHEERLLRPPNAPAMFRFYGRAFSPVGRLCDKVCRAPAFAQKNAAGARGEGAGRNLGS